MDKSVRESIPLDVTLDRDQAETLAQTLLELARSVARRIPKGGVPK